jgi:uncharacterized protein YjbI with pentapeptide repeats/beta-lactamase regulating signal transducer with metallopeptidase domain
MNLAPVVVVALGASTAASGILVGAIWLVARNPLLDAKARYFLWFGTLVVIGALPIVGIGASVAGAHRSAATANHWMPAVAQRGSTAAAPAPVGNAWKASTTPRDATAQQPVAATGPSLETALSAREHLASMNAVVALGLLATLALGALSGLIALLVGLARLAAVKRRSSPLDQTLARELPWLTATPSARESYLRLSYEIETPVAIGFGRPVILIPTDLATQSGLHAIEDLVVHEHAHIERYDDYTNLIQRVVERVLWFNPFVWAVGRQLSLEREIAADDAVVARTADSKRYAEALWQLAREMRMPTHALVAPGALFTRKQIAVRIEALMAPGRNRLHGLGPAGAAGALVVALLCVGLVAVAAPPLELPSAAAPRTVAWAPTRPSGAYDDSEALGALNDLAGFVDHRLSTMQGEVKSLGAHPSGARLDELTTTATLLGAKLETMESLAPRIGAPPAMRARIAALQTEETRLGDTLKQRMDEYDARENALRSSTAQTAKPAQVAPPAAPRSAPWTPERPATAQVPPASVDVHVDVPAVAADMPKLKWAMKSAGSAFKQAMNASGAASTMVAQAGGDVSRDTTLTRSLIEHCMGCDLSGRDLRNIDLHGLKITGADMTKTDLRGANLAGTEFAGTDLSGANLDGANLTNARFTGTDISNTTFHNARMDGVRFVGVSLRGTGLDPAGIRAVLLRGCEGCDLSHMNLRGVDFRGMELTGVDLSHSDLTGANLSGVRLKGVDLDSANLDRADLRHAVLEGCSLAHASLDGAQLEGISLVGTSLSIGNDP